MSFAPGDTLYSFRNDSKPVFQWQRDNVTTLAVYRSGALVAPLSGGYRIYAPRADLDATPLVSGPVVVASDTATFTITAASLPETVTLGPDYLEVWTLSMPDGKAYEVRRTVAVGRFQLFPPVTVADLVDGEYPDLAISLGEDGVNVLQNMMDSSWKAIIRHLENYGRWGDIVVNSSDVFDWHRHETLSRAFSSMLMRQANQRWTELMNRHTDQATVARQGLRITVDRDRDGRPDNLGKEAVVKPIVPNVPPRRRPRDSKFGV